jgi:two-component system, sensor histidine kinase and response regulator
MGEGSTFHFTAWLDKTSSQPRPRVTPGVLEGKRALVVDDHAGNRKILEQFLKAAKISVTCRDGGARVVETIEQARVDGGPFDVLLLDLNMPEMDGYMVADAIRNAIPNPPVMIVLSSALERDAQKCEKVGFDGFMAKPVRRKRLQQMIARLLSETPADAGDESRQHKMHTQYTVREAIKHSVRILLAEDNPVNQKLAVMMLGKAGYKVEIAVNGKEAVAKFTESPDDYDLIFMDVQMPEMDGKAATQTLRRLGFNEVPIIAMTAHAMKGDREMCLESGMNDYITKPIKRETVFEMINRYVLQKEKS